MDFLSDSSELGATDVMNFVREAIQRYNNLKDLILEKLLEGKKAVSWWSRFTQLLIFSISNHS